MREFSTASALAALFSALVLASAGTSRADRPADAAGSHLPPMFEASFILHAFGSRITTEASPLTFFALPLGHNCRTLEPPG